jgi:hypothetical protein
LVTINVAVLLVVIVIWRLRRRTEARSRFDEKLTVVIVLALGVLIAPTPVGEGIVRHCQLEGLSRFWDDRRVC